MTGEPVGDPLSARVKEIHNSVFSRGVASGASLRYQTLYPSDAPGAGWFFERFRISSRGGNGYQLIVSCESDEIVSADLIAQADRVDGPDASSAERLVSIR